MAVHVLVATRPASTDARTLPQVVVRGPSQPSVVEARLRRPPGATALAAVHAAAALGLAVAAGAAGSGAALALAAVGAVLAAGFWTGRRAAWGGAFALHGGLVALAAVLLADSARRSYYGAEVFALLGLLAGGVLWYLLSSRAVAWFRVARA